MIDNQSQPIKRRHWPQQALRKRPSDFRNGLQGSIHFMVCDSHLVWYTFLSLLEGNKIAQHRGFVYNFNSHPHMFQNFYYWFIKQILLIVLKNKYSPNVQGAWSMRRIHVACSTGTHARIISRIQRRTTWECWGKYILLLGYEGLRCTLPDYTQSM